MQIKTKMRYNYTLFEWQKFRTVTTPNAVEDMEQLSFTAIENAKYYNHLGRQFGGFLQK